MTPRVRLGLTVLAVVLLLVATATGTAWLLRGDAGEGAGSADRADGPRAGSSERTTPTAPSSPGVPTRTPPQWRQRWAEAAQALRQVDPLVESVLSYDYRTLDRDLARARAVMGPRFRKMYDRTMRTAGPIAQKNEAAVKATVQGSGVLSATPTRMVLLVLVDQRSEATGRPGRQDQSAVRVELRRAGGAWRLEDLQTNPAKGSPDAASWAGPRGASVLRDARSCVGAFLTTRAETFDAGFAAKLACTTGHFEQELLRSKDDLRRVAKAGRTNTTVSRLVPALHSLSGDRATVVVSASTATAQGSATGGPKRDLRIKVELHAVKGSWLISDLKMV